MRIRPEAPADVDAVRALNVAAFEGPAEAALVDALREAARPYLSLVADDDGIVAGHILFTKVDVPNVTALVMGLAPMAVRPDRQRRGIGSALVREGLDRCRNLKATAAIVLGHPEFYPRFGFVPADRFGLRSEYDVPPEVFMALELVPGALTRAVGIVKYHPAFNAHASGH